MADNPFAGARVVRWGYGDEEPADETVGMTHAERVVRSVYPQAEITDVLRERESRLGRKNPGSYHVQAQTTPGLIPVDVRPIPGMKFDSFVAGFKAKGLEVIEARDEVANPSAHATGPHWHVVLGDMEGLPAGAKIIRMGKGSAASSPAAEPGTLTPDDFKRRAGAIASDPSLSVDARTEALSVLSRQAGINIPEADLRATAENGAALLDFRPGKDGGPASLSTLRAAPLPAPGEADAPAAQVAANPRLRGVNEEVRKAINSKSASTEQVWSILKRYGIDPEQRAQDATLIPQVAAALQWRRENPGRPYTGKIDLEKYLSDAPEPAAPPPKSVEEANLEILRDEFGDQQVRPVGFEDLTIPQKLGERAAQLGELVGHSKPQRLRSEMETIANWTPLIGGAAAIEQSGADFERGDYGTGAINAALGSIDFIPAVGPLGRAAGKSAKNGIDTAALEAASTAADGTVDAARAVEHLRGQADEALAQGGRVTLHVEGKPVRIVKPGLVDETGRAWDATPILKPRAGDNARLEIDYPEPPPPAVPDKPQAASAEGSEGVPPGGRVEPGNTAALSSQGLPSAPVRPDEIVPIPGNQIEDVAEAARIGSPRRELKAPNEFDELQVRKINRSRVRGPIDITQSLRLMGGVKDAGGDLRHLGISNAPRKLEFGGNEKFLGRLIDNEKGVSLDDATERLWEEGYFPEFTERPTPNDLLDRLADEARGTRRYFRLGDEGEVADFHSAAAERQLIEAAADKGSPLVEDIGSPIGPEDLDAMRPPSSAYEDAPRLVGKIGNLNLERLEKPEDVTRLVQRVRDMVRVDNKALDRVSNEETRLLARDLDVTPDKILKGKEPLDAATMYATRVIVHQGRQKLVELAKRARGASDIELARFHNMVMAQTQLERQLASMTSEAGRMLQQFKVIASASDHTDDAIKAYLRGAGDRDAVETMAEAIIDLVEDPKALGHFLKKAARVRKRDMLNELWINSLLSGPRTHVVNAVSNTFTALWTLPEQALAAGLDKVTGAADGALLRDVGARAVGMVQGAREGLVLAKRAFITGEPADAVSKVEARNFQAIPGTLGTIIRIPTRALTASDELFKAVNRRAVINQLAYRRAMRGPGTAEERAAAYAQLRNDPDEFILKAADAEARYLTFQKPLGAGGRYLQGVANEWVGAKLILPFVRTPINIIKFAGERSPFAALMPEFREAIQAGGHARNEALAKLTIGTGLSALAVSYAFDGSISAGGPTDPEERAALTNAGWQPYSVRIGDRWVSYQRFEPLSLLVGVAADFAEVGAFASEEEEDSIALALAQSVAKNLTSKTWLSGVSDFFDALSDPERFGEAFISRVTSSMAVPAVVAHMAGSSDENLRESRTILDKIKERVPGLSSDIEARRNVWGDEMKRGDSLGPDYLSPVYARDVSKDPLMKEVARLKAPLTRPQRSLKVDGKSVRLTPEQYSYYVQLSGKPAKKYFEDFIGTPRWERMDDDERRIFLRKRMLEFRATARGQLKEMYPELQSSRRAQRVKARVKDGDTFAVDIRLLGTDAFEAKQKCQKPNGLCAPCGQGARQRMTQLFEGIDGKSGRKGLKVSFTGETTYGRPVATATIGGEDVGETLIREGWAVTEPKYLEDDPERLRRYQIAEAEARQSRRGAHAFRFNTPEQFRRGRRLQCEFAPGGSRQSQFRATGN